MKAKRHKDSDRRLRAKRSARRGVAILFALVVIAMLVAKQNGFLPNDLPSARDPVQETRSQGAPRESEFESVVIDVSDGDSLVVRIDNRRQRLRLQGIDCPESQQVFGRVARDFTRRLALNERVTIRAKGVDQYERLLAEVVLPDGRILNDEVVRAGLAWHYRQYSKSETLQRLEQEARVAQRGLWQDDDPVPPWRWRRENPRD